MMIHCPDCGSTNVRQLIVDSDEFICENCGENFTAETDDLVEEDDDD